MRRNVPFSPRRLQLQNKIVPSRSRQADTRGPSIIPQNSFFGYAEMGKRFVGIIFSMMIRCEQLNVGDKRQYNIFDNTQAACS